MGASRVLSVVPCSAAVVSEGRSRPPCQLGCPPACLPCLPAAAARLPARLPGSQKERLCLPALPPTSSSGGKCSLMPADSRLSCRCGSHQPMDCSSSAASCGRTPGVRLHAKSAAKALARHQTSSNTQPASLPAGCPPAAPVARCRTNAGPAARALACEEGALPRRASVPLASWYCSPAGGSVPRASSSRAASRAACGPPRHAASPGFFCRSCSCAPWTSARKRFQAASAWARQEGARRGLGS